jgi:hypothetical protein
MRVAMCRGAEIAPKPAPSRIAENPSPTRFLILLETFP